MVHGSAAHEEGVSHRLLALYPQGPGLELLGAVFLCIPRGLPDDLRLLEIGVECHIPVGIGRGEALQIVRRALSIFRAGMETRSELLHCAGDGLD